MQFLETSLVPPEMKFKMITITPNLFQFFNIVIGNDSINLEWPSKWKSHLHKSFWSFLAFFTKVFAWFLTKKQKWPKTKCCAQKASDFQNEYLGIIVHSICNNTIHLHLFFYFSGRGRICDNVLVRYVKNDNKDPLQLTVLKYRPNLTMDIFQSLQIKFATFISANIYSLFFLWETEIVTTRCWLSPKNWLFVPKSSATC